MKLRIELPLYAWATYELDKPDNWEKLSDRQKMIYLLDNCMPTEPIHSIDYSDGTKHWSGITYCDNRIARIVVESLFRDFLRTVREED